jgi:hypothetical protein
MGVRLLLVLSAVVLASAGCARPGPSESTTTTSAPTVTTPLAVNGFTIAGLNITNADETRAPHEDDEIHVKYLVRNDRAETFSRFVTYLENGEVVDTQTLRLGPGESRSFDKTLPPLRAAGKLAVEVRAGDQRANASVDVATWPRTGESVDLGPVSVRVERWLQDPDSKELIVNLTVERKALPDGDYHMLRAHALCATATGNVTAEGEARPVVPEPGTTGMMDLRLPGCPDIIYGIDLSGNDAADQPFYWRILFVDSGWAPPQA